MLSSPWFDDFLAGLEDASVQPSQVGLTTWGDQGDASRLSSDPSSVTQAKFDDLMPAASQWIKAEPVVFSDCMWSSAADWFGRDWSSHDPGIAGDDFAGHNFSNNSCNSKASAASTIFDGAGGSLGVFKTEYADENYQADPLGMSTT